jgi:hypothetical protein
MTCFVRLVGRATMTSSSSLSSLAFAATTLVPKEGSTQKGKNKKKKSSTDAAPTIIPKARRIFAPINEACNDGFADFEKISYDCSCFVPI